MIVAVASGKGGTGKTTVAVSLALAAEDGARLLDCDVEEPNSHIFIRPESLSSEEVFVPVPRADEDLCTACGFCGEVCSFNAIVSLKTKPLIFPELCHSCGACVRLCPQGALHEQRVVVGEIRSGKRGSVELVYGSLKIGHAMAVPVIRAVKQRVAKDTLTIVDCPPGTSCPVIRAVEGCDIVVLVTEPTPFGLHDLTLAVETMRVLGLPFVVVINRCDIGDRGVAEYCEREGIEILASVPNERRIAEAYSRGKTPGTVVPEIHSLFQNMLQALMERANLTMRAALLERATLSAGEIPQQRKSGEKE